MSQGAQPLPIAEGTAVASISGDLSLAMTNARRFGTLEASAPHGIDTAPLQPQKVPGALGGKTYWELRRVVEEAVAGGHVH